LATGAEVQSANVQIKSIGVTRTIMWNHLGSYGSYYVTGASGGSLNATADIWGGADNNGNTFVANTSWANPGIYQGSNSGPEFRFYSWITQGSSDKTAYIATIMAGTTAGVITSTDYTTMKVFIKIEQIVSR
jgi:hypothetical protein